MLSMPIKLMAGSRTSSRMADTRTESAAPRIRALEASIPASSFSPRPRRKATVVVAPTDIPIPALMSRT